MKKTEGAIRMIVKQTTSNSKAINKRQEQSEGEKETRRQF